MNSNNQITSVVHCKLAFNGQNRRFSFYGTEFTQLCEQVSLLIGLPVTGFVLKYVDNESDLITVSTNEEFAIALAISEKVLRLRAESVSVSPPSSPMVEDCSDGHHHYKKHHHGHHGHGHHAHHGHYGHHGHHGHHGHGRFQAKGDRSFSKCDRKEKKIELLKLFLSQMPPDESLTPAQSLRKAHLRQKIQKLEARKTHAWSDKEDNCKRRKWERKCKKDHKKHENLSPEVRQQVHQLKLQIIAIRPELCQLRLAKKQKKLELSNCLETGCGDKEAIWQEILDLKVKMNNVKCQIQPLKKSVKDLKASCKQQ